MNIYISYILRLLISSVCGIAIGFERQNRAKEAGIRTHCMVACGACLMMLVSKYGFEDFPLEIMNVADRARIAAQVVSGVGFLGAGVIFVKRQSISGLTTAAGIWVTAGIGMAIGAGMYIIGCFGTVFILLTQILLHVNLGFLRVDKARILSIQGVSEENYLERVKPLLKERNIKIDDVNISKKGDVKNYTLYIEIPAEINEENIISMFEYDCSLKAD